MINPKVPDQLIPTLSEVVPLDGARSISVGQLLNDSKSLLSTSNGEEDSGANPQINELADAVLQIVRTRLVTILPDLMREAVDEVLSQEGLANQALDKLDKRET